MNEINKINNVLYWKTHCHNKINHKKEFICKIDRLDPFWLRNLTIFPLFSFPNWHFSDLATKIKSLFLPLGELTLLKHSLILSLPSTVFWFYQCSLQQHLSKYTLVFIICPNLTFWVLFFKKIYLIIIYSSIAYIYIISGCYVL